MHTFGCHQIGMTSFSFSKKLLPVIGNKTTKKVRTTVNWIRPNHLSASPAFIFFQGSLTWMYWLPWREMLRMCFRESRILMKYLEKNGIKWQASSTYNTVFYRSSPIALLILRCWVEHQDYTIVLIDSNYLTSLNNTFNHATLLITFKPML